MVKNVWKKGLVIGIIILFIGASVVPSISGINSVENKISINSISNSIPIIPNNSMFNNVENNQFGTAIIEKEKDTEIISMIISEDVTIFDDGTAYLEITIDVSSPQLVNLYKETFGIPMEMDKIDMEIPVNATRIWEENYEGNITQLEMIEPVRKKFFEGIVEEQKFLFGFHVVEFYHSRILSSNPQKDLKIIVNANAIPYVSNAIQVDARNIFSMNSAPIKDTTDFIYSQMDASRSMLYCSNDLKKFEKIWNIKIIFPEKTDIDIVASRQGYYDFGGGSYIQTNISRQSESVLIKEKWEITRKPFTRKDIEIDSIFTIEFSIPGGGQYMIKNYEYDFYHDDFRSEEWGAPDWNFTIPLSGSDPVEYQINITLYIKNMGGIAYIDIGEYNIWAHVNFTAGIEIDGYISATWDHTFSLYPPGKLSGKNYNFRGSQPLYILVEPKPKAELYVGITGTITFTLNPEADFWFDAGGDLDFQWNWPPMEFQPVFDYGINNCSFDRSFVLTIEATVKPKLGVEIAILIFGIVGPTITPEVYLEGTIGWSSDTNEVYWHAILGFDLMVGIQFLPLGILQWDWPDPIIDIPIHEWDSEEDPGSPNPEDLTSPLTTLYKYPEVNGWTGRLTRFWFSAIDPGIDASGLDETWYNIPASQYGDTWRKFDYSFDHYILISNNVPPGQYDPLYEIKYYSIDNESNTEIEQSKWIKVDLLHPSSELSIGEPSSGDYVTMNTPITLSASDQGVGEWIIFYRIWFDGGWSDWNNSNCSWNTPVTFCFSEEGEHQLQWFAVDKVWNFENETVVHEESFKVYGYENYLVANANGPYSAEVDETITFDASKSKPSEIITGYRWDWTNDGTWDTGLLPSPTATHSYEENGLYIARLQIEDDEGETDIAYCAVHIGYYWEKDIVDFKGNVGRFCSLALDSNDYPHIAYIDETLIWSRQNQGDSLANPIYMKYAYWNGTGWEIETVDTVGGTTLPEKGYTSIAVDSDNNPHIAFIGGGFYDDDLEYAYKTGSTWTIQIVDDETKTIAFPSIALDSNDYPHISYHRGNWWENYPLMYAHWTGDDWDTDVVDDSSDNTGYWTSIAIDSDDYPHISYRDYDLETLKYARWTDSYWYIKTVDTDDDAGWCTSIDLDSYDDPHISYATGMQSGYTSKLKHASSTDGGSSWDIDVIDTASDDKFGHTSIEIDDSEDIPHIAFAYKWTVRYAKKIDSSWSIDTINYDDSGLGGEYPSIALDSSDLPHISHYGWPEKTLQYHSFGEGTNSHPVGYAGDEGQGFLGDTTYSGKSYEPILFDASAGFDVDGKITGYRWDWTNDGSWDTDWNSSPTINHSYLDSGTYTIKLQVKDNNSGTDTDTANVEIINSPPNNLSNPSPFDGIPDVSINTSLSWTGGDPDSGDTITYDIYLGSNPDPPFIASINKPATQETVTWYPDSLNYGTNYYWKIFAQDENGETTSGPIWNFTTELSNHPPNIASNPSPANESQNISNLHTILSWDGGDTDYDDIVTYDVYFGTNPDPQYYTTVGPYLAGQKIIPWNPGTLNCNTTYYWKIVVWDNHGETTAGPVWYFTTFSLAESLAEAVDSYNLTWSTEGANEWYGQTQTYYYDEDAAESYLNIYGVSWLNTTVNGSGILKFFWKVGLTTVGNKFSFFIDGVYVASPSIFWAEKNIFIPAGNHTLSWQLKKEGYAGIKGWLDYVRWMEDTPPNTPSNPSPANGSTNIPITANLSWTGGDPDPDDTVTYDIYFGNDSSPPLVVWNYFNTTYDPGTMEGHTQYYWKIVAWDNHGAYAEGPVWDFTTENNPPNTPSNPNPENGSTDVNIDADLSWNCSDPDGDPLTYNVYFEANDPTPDELVSENQTGTSYDPGTMEYETTYYWQIVAWDNHGAHTAGPIWSFTTEEEIITTTVYPSDYTIVRGNYVSGGLSDLSYSDDSYLVVEIGFTLTNLEPPVWLRLTATSPSTNPTELTFTFESHVNKQGAIQQTIELYNYTSESYEVVDTRMASTSDQTVEVTISSNPSRFINTSNSEMKAQLKFIQTGPIVGYPWQVYFDQTIWSLTYYSILKKHMGIY